MTSRRTAACVAGGVRGRRALRRKRAEVRRKRLRFRLDGASAPVVVDGVRVFGCDVLRRVLPGPAPEWADSPMPDARTGKVFGWWQRAGNGEVCVFGTTFCYSLFRQAEMLERILSRRGARPFVRSLNRNVLVETHALPDGSLAAFALNLHSSPQKTTLVAPDGAAFASDIALAPMEVRHFAPVPGFRRA